MRTDADGKFRFARLTPGRWWVGRHGEEISPNSTSTSSGSRETDRPEIEWNCTVRDGATTWVDVPPPAEDPVRLHGVLTFGGKPASGWRVTVSGEGGDATKPAAADLDAEGRFATTFGASGPIRLWFTDPTGGSSAMYVFATTTLKLGDNEWKYDVPVGAIEGSVSAAVRADSAKVSWNCVLGDGISVSGSLDSDGDGTFSLPRVPAGHVVFRRNSKAAGSEVLKELDLEAGAKLRVDL